MSTLERQLGLALRIHARFPPTRPTGFGCCLPCQPRPQIARNTPQCSSSVCSYARSTYRGLSSLPPQWRDNNHAAARAAPSRVVVPPVHAVPTVPHGSDREILSGRGPRRCCRSLELPQRPPRVAASPSDEDGGQGPAHTQPLHWL